MIKIIKDVVKIDTEKSTMLVRMSEKAELLYFGESINDETDYSFLNFGCAKAIFSSADNTDATPSVLSFVGDGSNRETSTHIVGNDGFASFRFEVDKFYIAEKFSFDDGLPHSKNATEYLIVEYKEPKNTVRLIQYFGIFENSDVIATGVKVINEGKTDLFVKRLFSIQLDLSDGEYTVASLRGSWGEETHETVIPLCYGAYTSSSFMGLSSNVANPFISLNRSGGERFTIAANLLYSGNHKEIIERNKQSGVRILSGINDYLLNYKVAPSNSFSTPEGIFVFAENTEKASREMREFVCKNIANTTFENTERPIVINSWESFGFKFDSERLYELCDYAVDCGIEMLVVDDGWFGNRNDDKTSLGDWFYNEAKIGGKLSEVARVVKSKNLKFGIWFEPEMVSEKSSLYKNHPEYAMKENGVEPIRIRNQIVLDITKSEVQKYIIDSISFVIEDCNVDYIKWDCNRGLTEIKNSGSYFYDYVISLYKILDVLTRKYPQVLFEGCASGGNRFDLGILYYMPQIWASDNTDAKERLFIQEGLLIGYPQSCISAHVPSRQNMHTFKIYSMFARFAVSAMAVLGYELDLTTLSEKELTEIKEYNAFYKKYRKTIQYGDVYQTEKVKDGGRSVISIVDKDKNNAVVLISNIVHDIQKVPKNVKVKGLEPDALYSVKTVLHKDRIDERLSVSGRTLEKCGVNIGNISVISDMMDDTGTVSSEIMVLTKVIRG